MMRIVVDASICLAWSFPDERDDEALAAGRAVVGAGAIVPALWRWEIQNALCYAERRGRLPVARVDEILRSLQALPISVDPEAMLRRLGRELQLARRFALTVYDAAYLELAVRTGLALATHDKRLAAAAADMGVQWKA